MLYNEVFHPVRTSENRKLSHYGVGRWELAKCDGTANQYQCGQHNTASSKSPILQSKLLRRCGFGRNCICIVQEIGMNLLAFGYSLLNTTSLKLEEALTHSIYELLWCFSFYSLIILCFSKVKRYMFEVIITLFPPSHFSCTPLLFTNIYGLFSYFMCCYICAVLKYAKKNEAKLFMKYNYS